MRTHTPSLSTRHIIVIAHNIRSTHNVGSLLRTADGLGVDKVYLTGYTPYPLAPDDTRLPHETRKLTAAIHKTALGAEISLSWQHCTDVDAVIQDVKARGYTVAAIEQAASSIILPEYHPPTHIALLVGREVEGIESELLAQMDTILEIPMYGEKESYNVVQAAAMALYHCRFSLP